MGIERLDPDRSVDVRAVAQLHLENFPDSTEARLGLDFLTGFFYSTIVREQLLECWIGRAGDDVVAFISFTRFPRRFHLLAVRRHLLRVFGLLVRAAIDRGDVRRVLMRHVGSLLGRLRSGSGPIASRRCGEVLKLAVLPEFETWTPDDGAERVTVRLFRAMQRRFLEDGIGTVLLVVRKDNVASNLFCHSMGCRLDNRDAPPDCNFFWLDLPAAGNFGHPARASA